MENKKIRIAITQGDINGIGYEVILKTFMELQMLELCTPIIYGQAKVAAYHRGVLSLQVPFNTIEDASQAQEGKLNVLNVSDEEMKTDLGECTKEGGRAAYEALDKAMRDWKEGKFDALVTAPINKSSIQSEDFPFVGHTEFLEARAGEGGKALMILFAGGLRVALVTTHMAIKDLAESITKPLIEQKATILEASLRRDFGIQKPRIAVLSLNPHAGDDGLLGDEEKTVIRPAIEALQEKGINAFGPFPSDGFFGHTDTDSFDGILAMYHDQGLAPFKALALDNGVNFTAGLPLVRTSPDHGTAFEIAGKGEAREASFRQAVYSAIDIVRNRQRYDEPLKNPLPKLYHERKDESEKVRFSQPKK